MNKHDKKVARGMVLILLGFLYVVISIVSAVTGMMDGGVSFTRCREPMLRAEYVFPAYRLGCWLGEVPGGEK